MIGSTLIIDCFCVNCFTALPGLIISDGDLFMPPTSFGIDGELFKLLTDF